MLILIKTPTITFSLDVQPNDDTDLIYTKVAERTEYKIFQFNLLFAGEPLAKGPVSGCGIRKEATVHMNVIKELKFNISHNGEQHQISVPNNDGLTIKHLITQIKNNLTSIPEISTHEIDVRKAGQTDVINKYNSLHTVLKNLDTLELVFSEKPVAKHISYDNTPAEVEDTQFDQDALLNSFLESSISSDVEIVFCFDTTGSMSSIIGKVKEQVEQTVSRLMKDIPNIRIGIMGLGDYCDGQNVLTTLDLSQDVKAIVKFIKSVPATSGGDAPEAYEWALRKAKDMTWSPHTSKAFVMIGDCEPHEPSHTDLHINWFEECDELFDMGVKIYGVKALGSCCFYEEIAERTGGICINFNKFSLITEMFLAICYREASKEKFDKYQSEINKQGVSAEMTEILTDLNKENFTVVQADKEAPEAPAPETPAPETTTTTTTASSSEPAPTPKSNVVVKQRGLPIKMRIEAAWFNHELDIAATTSFVYNKGNDSFISKRVPVTRISKPSSSKKKAPEKSIAVPPPMDDTFPATFTYPDGTISEQTITSLFQDSSIAPKISPYDIPSIAVAGDSKIGKTTFVERMNSLSNLVSFSEAKYMPFSKLERTSGFAICYDPNNKNSYDRVPVYINEIRRHSPKAVLFLISLKTDTVSAELLESTDPAKIKAIYNINYAFQYSNLDPEQSTKKVLKKLRIQVNKVKPTECLIM